MSYVITFNDIIPSLWSIYPEFNILKYVCKSGANNNKFEHIDIEDVILNDNLRNWFINYFNININFEKLSFQDVAINDLVNCLKFLEKKGKFIQNLPEFLDYVIDYDSIECFKYIQQSPKYKLSDCIRSNIGKSRGLLKKKKSYIQKIIHNCCKCNAISILKYCIEQFNYKITDDNDCCNIATESTNLECLKYLRSINAPWSEYTVRKAVFGGIHGLGCLKWAIENGCEYIPDLTIKCAHELNSIKYLHEELGIPLNMKPLKYYINLGSDFNFIKYICKNSQYIDMNGSCWAACHKNRMDILKFCIEQGGFDLLEKGCVIQACMWNNLNMLEYLIEIDCPWDKNDIINTHGYKDNKKISDLINSL